MPATDARAVIHLLAGIALLLLGAGPEGALADNRNEIGLRANVMRGDDLPADNVRGIGLSWRYYFDEGWFVETALESYDYEIEVPAWMVGPRYLPRTAADDLEAGIVVLSAVFGRHYGGSDQRFSWFWSAGLGVGLPDVQNIHNASDADNPYPVKVEAGTEIHLTAALGTACHFSRHWSLIVAGRVEHHFIDIQVTDSVGNAMGMIDSQSPVGGYLSLNYRY